MIRYNIEIMKYNLTEDVPRFQMNESAVTSFSQCMKRQDKKGRL